MSQTYLQHFELVAKEGYIVVRFKYWNVSEDELWLVPWKTESLL